MAATDLWGRSLPAPLTTGTRDASPRGSWPSGARVNGANWRRPGPGLLLFVHSERLVSRLLDASLHAKADADSRILRPGALAAQG